MQNKKRYVVCLETYNVKFKTTPYSRSIWIDIVEGRSSERGILRSQPTKEDNSRARYNYFQHKKVISYYVYMK